LTQTVTGSNHNPDAVNDSATVAEDSSANLIDVLANDSFAPDTGEVLSVTAVTQGANGSVALVGGVVSYTPAPNFVGTDSFSYTIGDGHGGSATANVSVAVTAVNDAPVANDDAATVAEDSANNVINVLANDTDLDGDTLTVTAVTQGTNGSVALVGGVVNYTPNPNFVGSDSFTYTISDGNGGSDSATVAITVTNANDAPVANDDAATVVEDSANNVIDVLANDTDADGDTLTVTAVTQGANGAVALVGGVVSYTPAAGFSGADSFTYSVSDGPSTSNVATVTVTVIATRRPPIANDDSATVVEDSGATPIAVLANDTDPDADPLTVTAVTQGTNGVVAITAGGTAVSYVPNPNFAGSDSFTYTISDGTGFATATVSVTVTPVNDKPDAVADAATVLEGSGPITIAVLANDTTVEAGETLTIKAVTQPPYGTVTIVGSTSVRYTPDPGFIGIDRFNYTIQDGNGGYDAATVTVTVQAKPSITIGDSEVFEGDLGFATALMTVRLSHAVVAPVTVRYATAEGIARAGQDYEATSGTLSFAAGEVAKSVTVKVIGDTIKERNEAFAVSLSSPGNAVIDRANGYVTIVDDDSSQVATTEYSNHGRRGGDRRDSPVLRPIDDQKDRAGERVKVDLKVRHGDIDDLSVTVEGLPQGLRYDVEEGAIVGRLSRNQSAAEYTVTVKISDGRKESAETFDWVVYR
jgi:hypothetical protein